MTLPPVPPWEGAHVLIVHFPVALLLTAPVLMFLAMFVPGKWPGMAAAAWIMLLLGTISAWVASSSGDAAFQDTGEMTVAARAIMHEHGATGERVRNIFTGICAAYTVVLLLPRIFKRLKVGPVRVLGTLVLLAIYAWGGIQLANAAHLGGQLVHEYGVRATIVNPETQPSTEPAK